MTRTGLDPRRWPLTLRAPVVAAASVLAVGLATTEILSVRLSAEQDRDFRFAFATYLDAVASAVTSPILSGDVWETFDALDRSSMGEREFAHPLLVAVDASGAVVASNEPKRFHVARHVPLDAFGEAAGDGVTLDADAAVGRRTLFEQGRRLGALLARLDLSGVRLARRRLALAVLVGNGTLAVVAAILAYFAVRRMLAPVGILATHLGSTSGAMPQIAPAVVDRQTPEFRVLFESYNSMARARHDREVIAERLAAEERVASLGRLASGIAHEINNPLGGLFAALDTLQRHDDQAARDRSLTLLRKGLAHIRDVVRSTLTAYRGSDHEDAVAAGDIDALRDLVGPEIRRKSLNLEWQNEIGSGRVHAAAGPIRQATLNLLLNATAAVAAGGSVSLRAAVHDNTLEVIVGDDGPGMTSDAAARLTSPEGSGAPPLGRGLGLWIVRRLADDAGARIVVHTPAAGGTRVEIGWPLKCSTSKGSYDAS